MLVRLLGVDSLTAHLDAKWARLVIGKTDIFVRSVEERDIMRGLVEMATSLLKRSLPSQVGVITKHIKGRNLPGSRPRSLH